MGAKFVWAAGLCLILAGTTGGALRTKAAPVAQINIPNINPQLERRFEQLRRKDEQERTRRENSEDAQKILFLAAELKQYADGVENGHVSPEGVRKAKEVEKLAKRLQDRIRRSTIRVH